MIEALNRFTARNPWTVVIGFAVATALFVGLAPPLPVNPDVEALFPDDNDNIVYSRWAEDYFGIASPAVFLISDSGPDGIFTPENLSLVVKLSNILASRDDLNPEDVLSLADTDNISANNEDLQVGPLFEEPPTTRREALAIRKVVFENPMMVGKLVSRRGDATIITAEVYDGIDKQRLATELSAIAAEESTSTRKVLVAGRPVVEGEMARIAESAQPRLMPLVLAVASFVLWRALHCLRGVLLPLMVVGSSIVWSTGLMAWTHSTFYAFNGIMPILLVPIGIADGIHIIDYFLHRLSNHADEGRSESVFNTMQGMAVPVIGTSITTAAGLASLSIAEINSMRSLGVFSAFGVIVAMVVSLTVLPAMLCLLPAPDKAVGKLRYRDAATGSVPSLLRRLANAIADRPAPALGVGVVLFVFALLGMPHIVVDASLVKNFLPDNPVRIADTEFSRTLGGSLPLEIVLDSGETDGWKKPEKLRAALRFQEEMEGTRLVSNAHSLMEFIRRMNAVMNPADSEGYAIPDSQDLVAQYLLLYSISGDPGDLEDVVDYDYRLTNLRLLAISDHSPALAKITEATAEIAARTLAPHGISYRSTGEAKTSETFIQLVVGGQIRSLILAILLVVLATTASVASLKLGLYAAVPVVVATALNFGLLGWIGVPLGVTTAVLSSIALGIGVDYAIHFVVRYRACLNRGLPSRRALEETMATAGSAIFFNALIVVSGFLVLLFSEFVPNRVLGLLVAVNMVVCLVVTLTSLAALLYKNLDADAPGH